MSGNLAVSTINGVDISVSPVATQAFANSYDLGVGQTWQDVTSNRTLGVNYTNSTGKPIVANLSGSSSSSGFGVSATVNGVTFGRSDIANASLYTSLTIIIPNGATYTFNNAFNTATTIVWSELR